MFFCCTCTFRGGGSRSKTFPGRVCFQVLCSLFFPLLFFFCHAHFLFSPIEFSSESYPGTLLKISRTILSFLFFYCISGSYDPSPTTNILVNRPRPRSAGDRHANGDAKGDMSESSKHVDNSSFSRRRPRPQLANVQLPFGQISSSQAPSPNPSYPVSSSSSSSESVHHRSPTNFQASPYGPPNPQYNQPIGFVAPYPMSTHPSPIPMAHTTPPFVFSPYHHTMSESSMISQNIHANYPPIFQSLSGHVYPYLSRSDGNSSTHPPFHSTSMYPTHHAPTRSAPPSRTHSYSGPFQPLRYPSPISSTPFSYARQPFSPTPMFQSQYPHPTYSQHYSPTAEHEPQGTWIYLPHAPVSSPSPYDSGRSFQSHFHTFPYSQPVHSGTEAPYDPPAQSSPTYLESSTITGHNPSQFSESQLSADLPRYPGGSQVHQSPLPASSAPPKSSEKPIVRRSYHPNPPAHRSEWVMWVGNVPSDATHDELWRFFNQPPPPDPPPTPMQAGGVGGGSQQGNNDDTGVLSIFLISRSNCSFINYKSEPLLQEAIKRFNGMPLRPNDPRCPRLVCRVRRVDDDLKAGVGGQRGMGMHTKWIKERKEKERERRNKESGESSDPSSPSSSLASVSERMAAAISAVSISSDELQSQRQQHLEGHGKGWQDRKGTHAKQSSSSGSYTSTNSGFLVKHFPKRYFILKSLTQVSSFFVVSVYEFKRVNFIH